MDRLLLVHVTAAATFAVVASTYAPSQGAGNSFPRNTPKAITTGRRNRDNEENPLITVSVGSGAASVESTSSITMQVIRADHAPNSASDVQEFISQNPGSRELFDALPQLVEESLGKAASIMWSRSIDQEEGDSALIALVDTGFEDQEDRARFETMLFDRIYAHDELSKGLDCIIVLQA